MSEQPTISPKSEKNARTARAVASILSRTRTDELLRGLNQSDGRSQSEQASRLGAESPFLREIYERGGTVAEDGILTVPRENLTAPPEIEITTTRVAVDRLTRITGDVAIARELAPELVAHGERIAGSQADGATRLKVFGWLYSYLEGKQELFEGESPEIAKQDSPTRSEAQFAEKWQQIVELSEALAELEPKDRLPENSLEAAGENLRETAAAAVEPDENLTTAEIYENAGEARSAEYDQEFASGGSLIAFERIETENDLPRIPENLSRADFEKLLEKTPEIDSQIERGAPVREVLAPFRRYVEITRLDNELRLVEKEFARIQAKIIGGDTGGGENHRFVIKREELRELDEDQRTLGALREQKAKLGEIIQTSFGEDIDRTKVELAIENQTVGAKSAKIELTEDEAELRRFLVKEKIIGREIDALAESVGDREKGFRNFADFSAEVVPDERKQELLEKVTILELPAASVLKDKYPELTPQQRNEKLRAANTFEVRTPAEYLFVRDAANKHFEISRNREIKNEYRKLESAKPGEKAKTDRARRESSERLEKIQALKTLEPIFTYKIEGSNRLIKAEPSERAVAGYKFAAEYVRYQLKQPETRARHQSPVYREYAARLEAAKTAQDVVRESYKIRQENHRAAGVWKNSNLEERQKLRRPLSKNEIQLLFLEQPPRAYTAEMSVLKYNFAHYAQAKEEMTDALENGKLQPSAEAVKLNRSLESRLNRRDLETKRKATRHFFESLKTEDEKLAIKNDFDHRAVYQNLPPHEKDWIYRRAAAQRENLEYKIAYERKKNASQKLQPRIETANATSEAATNLRQEFAAGTLWYQAASLSSQKEPKRGVLGGAANLDEETLKTIGFLIHNHSQTNNLRVGGWLAKQKSEELQTAGEILTTFARGRREFENNRLTVTVKIEQANRVSYPDYQNLFDRYFPADFERLKEFRVNRNEKFRLENSRRDGQSVLLDAWKQDAQTAIYHPDAPLTVLENERRQLEEIERIKAAQIECRRAIDIKNAIARKYEEKLKKEFSKTSRAISDGDLRAAVELAFSPEKSGTPPPVEQKGIFELAQHVISHTDFDRFTESSNHLEKGINDINRSFESIVALRLENTQYKFAPEKSKKAESLQNHYEKLQQQAEAEQITAAARENFSAKTLEGTKRSAALVNYLSDGEREKAQIESHRQARIALEPAALYETDQSTEIRSKALEFADALENAHQMSLNKKSGSEIARAFAIAEAKREQLDEFLKIEKKSNLSPENKPVTLLIYERELARNERLIAQAKITQMIETGKLSLADLETKKAGEIFSVKVRASIKLEAGERTRENLEPKELWAKRGEVAERVQRAALAASEALEKAHEIYHDAGAEKKEIARAFTELDGGIVKLKNERRTARAAARFFNFKNDFKRDLAQILERGQPRDDSQLLAAMTKGLLINSLEKQNVPPEKIGLSSEKLSEISRTITLAMVDYKKHQKAIAFGNRSGLLPVQNNHDIQTQTHSAEKSHVPIKTRLFEHKR